jgi:HEAT repeat protein/WD40 repeat protein
MGRLGLARTQDEPEADEAVLTSSLADPSWAVRVSAVQKLGKMGKQAPLGLLVAAMRDEQSSVRVAAARALSRNPRQAAISALVAALEDSEWLVRAEVALALGEMRELAPLEPLLVALQDKDPTVRASAAKALGESGASGALEPLNRALQDEDWSVREAAALALARLELDDQAVVPPLLNARMDRDPAVREAAETGLLRVYPEIASVPPPPSDSLADWLERIDFPPGALLAQASNGVVGSASPRSARRSRQTGGRKRSASRYSWSRKAMNAAEGALAAVIITSLFIVWLAIETQPRSTQGQATPSSPHTITFTTFREHYSDVEKVAWSPDGQNIASADIRGMVYIWQASTGRALMNYSYPRGGNVLALTWDSPNSVFVAYGEANKSLQVVELMPDSQYTSPSSFPIFHRDNLPAEPAVAAWSSDHQTLAFDAGDGSVQIANVTTNQTITTINGDKHTQYSELAWSPDDNQLATLSSAGLLDIWDTYMGTQIISLTTGRFVTLATWVSCGRYQSDMLFVDSSSALLQWSYGRREQVHQILTEQAYNLDNASNLVISALAVSPDRRQVLLATSDGLVQTRDILTGNLVSLYIEHSAQVNDIEWSPGGRHIATASLDTTVKIWQEP